MVESGKKMRARAKSIQIVILLSQKYRKNIFTENGVRPDVKIKFFGALKAVLIRYLITRRKLYEFRNGLILK